MKMIGEILVEKGYVTQQQLDGVMAVKGDDAQVGQVLIQWGLLTEQQLMEALEIQTPPPPPPPPPPVQQPIQPVQPGYPPQPGIPPQTVQPVAPPPAAPDLSMDNLQTKKFNFDLKTLIFIGSGLVSLITMYFTFQNELDTRFAALENTDDTVMVELDKRLTTMETSVDKRLTELENKFTPIGDGVYTVDPNSTWPPSRGEYKMKDELSRNKITELEKTIERLEKEIEKLEDKLDDKVDKQ
jgi:uncharacterized small protein (DUF1192 family)